MTELGHFQDFIFHFFPIKLVSFIYHNSKFWGKKWDLLQHSFFFFFFSSFLKFYSQVLNSQLRKNVNKLLAPSLSGVVQRSSAPKAFAGYGVLKRGCSCFNGEGPLGLFTTSPTIHCIGRTGERCCDWPAPGLNATAARLIWSFEARPFHSGVLC